jgi:hypothetical protein
MNVSMSDYQISDEDIDATVRYFKIHQPEHATREFAEAFLQYWKAEYREISLQNLGDDTMEKLLKAYTDSLAEN